MGSVEEKRVLITGATGFVGSNLTAKLLEAGARVNIISKNENVSKNLILRDLTQKINVYRCDLRDFSRVKKCLMDISPEIVYHLGAVVDLNRSFEIAQSCMSVNIQGTLNMLHACEDMYLESFVLTSTSEIYKNGITPFQENNVIEPKSPYAISKAASEQLCIFANENYGIPTVILRLSTIYGPNQKPERLIPYTIISCLKDDNLSFTSGEQTRDFTYVGDIVEGIIRASSAKKAIGETINMGSEIEYSVKEVVHKILALMRCNKKTNFGAIPNRNLEIPRWVCNIQKAKKLLRWEPKTDLEAGLKKTVEWYKIFYL